MLNGVMLGVVAPSQDHRQGIESDFGRVLKYICFWITYMNLPEKFYNEEIELL
jgi:hypothetical protein